MIDGVLRLLSFILHVEHFNWILTKSLFKELAAFIKSNGDVTSAYKVVSSAYEIIFFKDHQYKKWVTSKKIALETPETTGLNWLKFLSTEIRCWRLDKKYLNIYKKTGLPTQRPWILIYIIGPDDQIP